MYAGIPGTPGTRSPGKQWSPCACWVPSDGNYFSELFIIVAVSDMVCEPFC